MKTLPILYLFCTICFFPGLLLAQTNFVDSYKNPVLGWGGTATWDAGAVWIPAVIKDADTLRMWYTGYDVNVWSGPNAGIGYAWSLDGIKWNRYEGNPVMTAELEWELDRLSFCAAIKDVDTFKLWYGGAAPAGSAPTTIGYATSMDGKNWIKQPDPVLECGPENDWDDALICPSTIIREEDNYKMWYYGGRQGFPFESAMPQTGLATSPDGIHWTKYNDVNTSSAPYVASDPVIMVGEAGEWDSHRILGSMVLPTDNGYEAWYQGLKAPIGTGTKLQIGYATSEDGINWIKWPENPVFKDRTSVVEWGTEYYPGTVLYFEDYYHMWFSCFHTNKSAQPKIGYASTNYIAVSPPISNIAFLPKDSMAVYLGDYFSYIQGEPDSTTLKDTISYSLIDDANPEFAALSLINDTLYIQTGNTPGSTSFEIMASAGFTKNYRKINVYILEEANHKLSTCQAEASSYYDAELYSNHAIDGYMETRWGSEFSNNQWLTITLDTIHEVSKVIIYWEVASAKVYKLYTSVNNRQWIEMYYETSGDGETDFILFKPTNAKYIKLEAIEANSPWGFSIWEFEVYSTDNINVPCVRAELQKGYSPPEEITIYPNPVKDYFYIEFKDKNEFPFWVEVLDISGKTVFKDILLNYDSYYKFDLHTYKEGIYFIRILNKKYSFTKRIIRLN